MQRVTRKAERRNMKRKKKKERPHACTCNLFQEVLKTNYFCSVELFAVTLVKRQVAPKSKHIKQNKMKKRVAKIA